MHGKILTIKAGKEEYKGMFERPFYHTFKQASERYCFFYRSEQQQYIFRLTASS